MLARRLLALTRPAPPPGTVVGPPAGRPGRPGPVPFWSGSVPLWSEPDLGPHAVRWTRGRSAPDWSLAPQQGRLGDCWLLAPMLAVHAADPDFFRSGVRRPAPGQVAVRLFHRGLPYEQLIADRLPADDAGRRAYAREHGPRGRGGWPGLLEKAAAAAFGGYRRLRRGLAAEGFRLLTGQRAPLHLLFPSPRHLAALLERGHAAVASTQPLAGRLPYRGLRFTPLHVYAVVAADPSARTVTLRNPWGRNPVAGRRRDGVRTGDGELILPWSVFRTRFLSMNITAEPLARASARRGSLRSGPRSA